MTGALSKAKKELNLLGRNAEPALFIIDFLAANPVVIPLKEIDCRQILYEINGTGNAAETAPLKTDLVFRKYPQSFEEYERKFSKIQYHLHRGDSYLLNLTCATPVNINLSLADIFHAARAKYKLLFEDRVLVFSPETFIKIRKGKIFTRPMKGTIDAALPDAERVIIEDSKELSEQFTIVDLMRNDLNSVALNVKVDRFRYIEKLQTNNKTLLQVSSEITGDLPLGYEQMLGDILFSLLPAGSVTGAPKKRTVEIILDTEGYDRGYYSGVFGLFDGKDLDSAVMIRYLEQSETGLIFKSGGGITTRSCCETEYNEMIDKIYVPVV